MRFVIIGLSIIFFTLSAIITFKALRLPVHIASNQDDWKDVTSESGDVIKKWAENQDASRVPVTDLPMTITQFEDKLATKKEVLESVKTTVAENRPRTLTIFGGGTFRSGQDAINDVAVSTIENLVEEISASPGSRVIIEGHTDNIPTGKLTSTNLDLSLLRAKAIANILVSHGISLERISESGYGDTRPIASNDTEEGRAKNRRVEVKLMPEEEGEN
ncbi:MAG: OmpA family protein [Nitrosomonas sp.]|nr:OmpA family protein [Nitrosomonas sp.]MDP1951451.1 OmpA family protein [Nitrosomonas sp.]